jgi:hypothetical protein
MIKKLPIAILASVVAFAFATPTIAHAAASSNTKIKALLKKLKKLPNADAPTSKVTRLAKQLAKLSPKKAKQYYKIAIQKFQPPVAETQANKLANTFIKIVKKADLPAGKINSLIKQIKKLDDKFIPPVPTPTPYQAMILSTSPLTSTV